jgi:hypothetical protein
MVHTYDITVPITLLLVAITDNHIVKSNHLDLKLDFVSDTPITQKEIEQAEFYLQGKPITYESALIKYIDKLAEECMEEVKPLVDTLYAVNLNYPKIKTKVVLNGKIRWQEILPDTKN